MLIAIILTFGFVLTLIAPHDLRVPRHSSVSIALFILVSVILKCFYKFLFVDVYSGLSNRLQNISIFFIDDHSAYFIIHFYWAFPHIFPLISLRAEPAG